MNHSENHVENHSDVHAASSTGGWVPPTRGRKAH